MGSITGSSEFKTEESMPMSPGQIKDTMLEMITQNSPETLQMLGFMHPENLGVIDETMGFPGWTVPGASERARVHTLKRL